MTAAPEGVRPLPKVHAMPLSELRESAENPRRIPDRAVELVALSLRRFGWKQPLVVDANRELVVGHTRFRAARSLGLANAPVVIAEDLTPEEVSAYRIADNRTHDFTAWDLTALSGLLDDLSDEFADVLALTDWEAVISEVEQAAGTSAGSSDTGGVVLPEHVVDSLDGGFMLNVSFHTKEQALAAQEAILALDGAFNVRHDFA